MERRPFGRTGHEVPIIGQGTWQVRDHAKAKKALVRGLELGMKHIDTAELYKGSEETIAPVIKGRRDQVFLVSKVLPSHATFDGTRAACRASLSRLGTERLDVYLLHWWDERRQPSECMRAMGTLIDEGLIGAAGVSNFSLPMLERAMENLAPREIACNQVLYHLWERSIETDVVPFCRKKGIAVVGYTPFGPGGFPEPESEEGQVLGAIAKAHRKTPRQVVLRFLTRDAPLFAIPKAEQVAHVEENAGGQRWSLTRAEVAAIDEAFPVEAAP